MKTKLILFILLSFMLSMQVIANDKSFSSYSNEVETLMEYENNEKDIEQEALLSVDVIACTLKDMSSVLPSSIFLDNYLSEDMVYKPPITYNII